MDCVVDKAVVHSSDGSTWYQLHFEREGVCETLLKRSTLDFESPLRDWHEELLQRRLRKIDNALDRLMTGSYGNCIKCGRGVDRAKLALDPAIEFCLDCWKQIQNQEAIERAIAVDQPEAITETSRDSPDGNSLSEGIDLETLAPLDTICVCTRNSDYRIFLLDPETGRALVQGGKHFAEPVEALIYGSVLDGETFKVGSIGRGMRLEIITNKSVTRTSPVQSFYIETHAPVELMPS